MAQNVTIAGRQYSAVPAIDVPKTGGGTATFTDVTDTTRIAGDVRQGKYFFTASGVLTLGTATGGGTGGVTQDQDGYLVLDDQPGTSITVEPITITQNGTTTAPAGKAYSPVTVNVSGGGGGAEFESGTWQPTQDIARGYVQFTNAHTEPPVYVCLVDADSDYISTDYSNALFIFSDFYRATGSPVPYSLISGSTQYRYSSVVYYYRTTNTNLTYSGLLHAYPSNDPGDADSNHPRYWASTDGFHPYSNSSSRYWRAGRTYKWYAIWKPSV